MDKYYRMSREQFEKLNQEQQASGLKISDFCKQQGFSKTSFYYWRQKFGMINRPTDNDPHPAPLTPIIQRPSPFVCRCSGGLSSVSAKVE